MFEQLTTYAPWLIPVIALGGIVGVGWKYVKLIWGRVTSVVIIHIELENTLADEAMIYFWENYRALPVNPRRFVGWHIYIRKLKVPQLVALEQMGGTGLLFWNGWRPLWVSSPDKKDADGKASGPSEDKITITFIRGTFSLDDMLKNACEGYNSDTRRSMQTEKKRKSNRFYVMTKSGCRGRLPGNDAAKESIGESKKYIDGLDRTTKTKRPLGYTWTDLGEQPDDNDPSPFEFFAYPAHVMKLVKDLEHWLSSQKWYADRRIPWRWGALSTGPPGSGKSCLIRSVGEHLGIPVHFFDLASMTNEDFIDAWTGSVHKAPCIVAMEDIDSVFNGRVNITAEKGSHTLALTFDCLLNRISGVTKADGIILFVTSNNAETLDQALCDTSLNEPSRPGRIDTRIILDGIDEDCRTRVAKIVLKDDPEYVDTVVKAGKNDQPSQFHNRCTKLAQTLHWARRDGKDPGDMAGLISAFSTTKASEVPSAPAAVVRGGR